MVNIMQSTNSFMTNQTPKDEGHSTDWASEEIIGQENHLLSRKIPEAINILTRRLEMNSDQGNHLPSIYGFRKQIVCVKEYFFAKHLLVFCWSLTTCKKAQPANRPLQRAVT